MEKTSFGAKASRSSADAPQIKIGSPRSFRSQLGIEQIKIKMQNQMMPKQHRFNQSSLKWRHKVGIKLSFLRMKPISQNDQKYKIGFDFFLLSSFSLKEKQIHQFVLKQLKEATRFHQMKGLRAVVLWLAVLDRPDLGN